MNQVRMIRESERKKELATEGEDQGVGIGIGIGIGIEKEVKGKEPVAVAVQIEVASAVTVGREGRNTAADLHRKRELNRARRSDAENRDLGLTRREVGGLGKRAEVILLPLRHQSRSERRDNLDFQIILCSLQLPIKMFNYRLLPVS